MQVTLQYAAEHLDQLASSAMRGEAVEIAQPGGPNLRLSVVGDIAHTPKQSLLNSAKGQIQFADDWDSSETNQKIADLFEGSALVGGTAAE